ncbi:7217_t:CDS:2 [Entrophospora sp. SA101]|nr:7217_t:CDS:2 [Entrophospora sp. SA101]CAJ0846611.1 18267_t:CDS:2 [Entrophospora sp. SA101]
MQKGLEDHQKLHGTTLIKAMWKYDANQIVNVVMMFVNQLKSGYKITN